MNLLRPSGTGQDAGRSMYCSFWVMLAILLCLLIPVDSFALMGDMPGPEEDTGPRIQKSRRARVSIGPVKSKRPGGLGEGVFKKHIDSIENYFLPMAGNIVSVSGGAVTSDLSPGAGVTAGMKFKVMRATGAFVHPVTGERVTGTETEVGMAEAIQGADATGVRLVLTEGEALRGDVVRVSSAPVPVFFYQAADVDWDVSEEYYYWLDGSDRFRILDAPPGAIDDGELLKSAAEAGASFLLTISAEDVPEGQGPGLALRQRALWVPDGKEFYSSVMVVDEKMLGEFKIAGEMFWPKKGKPVFEMTAPFRAVLMTAADLNCDGEDEMVLSTGTSLRVFALDIQLRPPFGLEKALEITGDMRREHVWLEAADIDNDGCDEILVSTVKDEHEARSFVYDYSGGQIRTLWEDDVFARIIDGSLHVQDFDNAGGYRGGIRNLGSAAEDLSDAAKGEELRLPDGVNLYDFAFMNSGSGARDLLVQDSLGHLVLYNGISGEPLWRSEDSYGGAFRKFRKASLSLPGDDEAEMWHVSDRMLSLDSQVFAIYKVPVSKSIPGLGFKGSGIIRITAPGPETKEDVFIRDIPRAAVGMAISGRRLYVLSDTSTLKLLNIFKGRKLFVSRIQVYSLEGI